MKKIVLFCLIFAGVVLVLLGALGVYYYLDLSGDVLQEIRNDIIERATDSESYVYYDDRTSVMGVFFDKVHQSHVKFRDIPDSFIKALIAVEDRNFYHHHGVDIKAICRAAITNLRAGKIVQGGSTITQQTAKNLFTRQKRSYGAKFRELVQAIHLEKTYTKEEILEFYANQFYVAGMGRGISVAAQYYFNKNVKDLNLIEAAFIAGSIKGPGKYNPFTKKNDQARQTAIQYAEERKDYVLQCMMDEAYITDDQYLHAIGEEVPFQKGKISYELSSVMDYIRKQLQSNYFKDILAEQGIDNIATSGIRIHTSINREIQEGAVRSLRHHLSLIDTMLSGYDSKQLNRKYDGITKMEVNALQTSDIYIGRIKSIETNKESRSMVIVLANGEEGIVDVMGMKAICNAWIKSKFGIQAEIETRHITQFLNQFHPGDQVAVQYMVQHPSTGNTFRLTKLPELQGGVIVLHDGMIKAMVGGYFTHYWNRAVDSKRQLGSIFKPIVYTAALQLNWHILDPLSNIKELFRFEKTDYLPMPDHDPPAHKVSMVWAGAKSENLASVWLFYYLTDRLNTEEFSRLVEIVGLAKKINEPDNAYIRRIRDQWGIMYNDDNLLESAFQEAKKNMEAVPTAMEQEYLVQKLKYLRYKPDVYTPDGVNHEERKVCPLSFTELQAVNLAMKKNISTLAALIQNTEDTQNIEANIVDIIKNDYYLLDDSPEGSSRVMYAPLKIPFIRPFVGHPVTPEWLLNHIHKIAVGSILIQGLLPSETVDLLSVSLDTRYTLLKEQVKNSDPAFLYALRDFKTLVGMLYVTQFSRKIGISTPLEPVLSFPLGANAVSIAEMAVAYQTMMTTQVYPFAEANSADMIPIITKIVDRNGITLWTYHPDRKKQLSDRVSRLCGEILKMAVEKGTGQGAKNAVQIRMQPDNPGTGIPVPVCGKTGTSDSHINSSFVGYIPEPASEGRDNGYIITSYVGYDDNRPMKGKKVTIYGSSGAMPIWIDTANAVVNSGKYRQVILPDLEPVFGPPASSSRNPMLPVVISPIDGLPIILRETGDRSDILPYVWADIEISDVHNNDPSDFVLKRKFEPLLVNKQE